MEFIKRSEEKQAVRIDCPKHGMQKTYLLWRDENTRVEESSIGCYLCFSHLPVVKYVSTTAKNGYINASDYKKIEVPGDEEWLIETNGAWASKKFIKWAKEITEKVNLLPNHGGKK